MMVALLRPTPDDIICDPACGTAGFLISAAEYIRTHYESTMTTKQWDHFTGPAFTGYDTDPTMLRIFGHESHAALHYTTRISATGQRVQGKHRERRVHHVPRESAVQGQHQRRRHQRFSESRDQHQKKRNCCSSLFFCVF